jgi:hypothetical protein
VRIVRRDQDQIHARSDEIVHLGELLAKIVLGRDHSQLGVWIDFFRGVRGALGERDEVGIAHRADAHADVL